MNFKNTTLLEMVKKLTTEIIENNYSIVNVLFEKQTLHKELIYRLDEKNEQISEFEKKIDAVSFKSFILMPQINDVVENYMSYLLKINILRENIKDKIIADDVNNYFLKIINENYTELSGDDCVFAIKEFFKILWSICSDKFDKDMYSNFDDKKNDQLVIPDFLIENELESRDFNNTVQKIKKGMNSKFVRRNTQFETTKTEYTKALKTFYQSGFIYLLGEYKFNEFYIAPLLLSSRMARIYRKIKAMPEETHKKEREFWKNMFRNNDIVYVVGGAGYGKSLFLNNIINNYKDLNLANSRDYLIIYCDLKTFYSNGDSNKKSMVDFFRESMINKTGCDTITKEFIQYYLDSGRCIILLDALDEVNKEMRNELHKKIISFFSICNLNNKVCITSRDSGFIPPQQDNEIMEIFPLTVFDIEEYINKIIELKKFKKEDKNTFMEQAQVLIDKDFLNNFLVLSLLVNIYKSERELPENKIDLYKKCFEYIAIKREKDKSKIGYDWNRISLLMKDSTFISLSVLAAPNNKDIEKKKVEELLLSQYKRKYADESATHCAIHEFLEFCSNRTELFVLSSTDEKFKFFHRSFFDYFYSRYIHQQSEIENMYELMTKFDIDSEVFELTVALVKEDNEDKYQRLIDYIFLKVEGELVNDAENHLAFCILTLGMQVIDDACYISKYFNIVINHSKLMTEDKIFCMNQNLMYMLVEKEIREDSNRKEKFKAAFEDECVYYLLKMMINTLTEGIKFDFFKYMEINEVAENDISIITNDRVFNKFRPNIPFYILVYKRYYDIYDLLENYGTAKLYKLLNSKLIKRKEKTDIKKGYNSFKNLSEIEQKQFIKFLGL